MGKCKSRAWSDDRYRFEIQACIQRRERIRKDTGIYDDVESYMVRHDTSVDGLVTKLLNNEFGHFRYSDQEYLF